MTFTPKTEAQLKEKNLWPDGSYDFRVQEAEEGISTKGNEQIKLKLVIYKGEASRFVYDYLSPLMEFKLRHFCEATGLISKYDSGRLTADDMIGREGIVQIRTEPAKGNFEAKNAVKDYVVKKADIRRPDTKTASLPLTAKQPAKPDDDDGSEVPF
jgi:hypothetical protein